MLQRIKRLFKDEDGATMVEYALMLALIAVICIAVVSALGQKAGAKFDESQQAMDASPGEVPVTP